MEFIFDTETSGLPKYRASYKEQQPWIVQIGGILCSSVTTGGEINLKIHSNGRKIEKGAQDTHHISQLACDRMGVSEQVACLAFIELVLNADLLVCHNAGFDKLLVAHMLFANDFKVEAEFFWKMPTYCTMLESTSLLKLPQQRGGGYKWPKLEELYKFLFSEMFEGAHDAMADVRATQRCYYKLKEDVPF